MITTSISIDFVYINVYSTSKLQNLVNPLIEQLNSIKTLIYKGDLEEAKNEIKLIEPLLVFDHEYDLEHPLFHEIQMAKMLIRTKEILRK